MKHKCHLVVFDDGRRVSGSVMIRAGKTESGQEDRYNPVLVQNGVETVLTRVAHIKFAAPKVNSRRPRSRRTP